MAQNIQSIGAHGALIKAGDQLQSEASRMAEWIRRVQRDGDIDAEVPYEVMMAAIATTHAVQDWTEARIAVNRERQ